MTAHDLMAGSMIPGSTNLRLNRSARSVPSWNPATRQSALIAAAGLMLLPAVITASPAAQAASSPVAEGDMMRYCQGEVAAKYNVSPRDIQTLPVERQGGGYQVYGQTPSQGEKALFFICNYNASREFTGIKVTSDARGSSGRSEPISVQDMPRYCSGMAAEKFKQSPRAITTNPASKQPNNTYLVYGQYNTSPTMVTVFRCRFGSKGRFKTVELTN